MCWRRQQPKRFAHWRLFRGSDSNARIRLSLYHVRVNYSKWWNRSNRGNMYSIVITCIWLNGARVLYRHNGSASPMCAVWQIIFRPPPFRIHNYSGNNSVGLFYHNHANSIAIFVPSIRLRSAPFKWHKMRTYQNKKNVSPLRSALIRLCGWIFGFLVLLEYFYCWVK